MQNFLTCVRFQWETFVLHIISFPFYPIQSPQSQTIPISNIVIHISNKTSNVLLHVRDSLDLVVQFSGRWYYVHISVRFRRPRLHLVGSHRFGSIISVSGKAILLISCPSGIPRENEFSVEIMNMHCQNIQINSNFHLSHLLSFLPIFIIVCNFNNTIL